MKIPNKIKMGPHWVNIEHRKMDELCGFSDHSNLTIDIDSSRPQSIQEETFFHEVLHVIREMGGVADKDKDIEEQQVQVMAYAFYQVLKENNFLRK